MRLRNMLEICLVFWKSEPRYAYKRYAYKKKTCRVEDDAQISEKDMTVKAFFCSFSILYVISFCQNGQPQ